MADNQAFVASVATYTAATDKVTYSGDANVDVQLVRSVAVTGAEGSKTVVDLTAAAGSPSAAVLTVQGVASGTVLPANVTQLGGQAVTLGAGAVAAGTLRVTFASDAPGMGGIGATTDTAALPDTDGTAISQLRGIGLTVSDSDSKLGTLLSNLAEDATHDISAPTSGPQMMAYGSAATPAAVAPDADAVRVWADLFGRLHTFNERAVDAVYTAGDVGNMVVGRRIDTLAPASGSSGDFEVLNTNASGALWSAPSASTNGGATPGMLISGASTNATSVKASAGQVYSLQVINLNALPRYLKLYNKASAPTVGTDTPVQTYPIPPNSTTGGGFTLSFPVGLTFTTGIALALTTGVAVSDTVGVAANEIIVNYSWK